MANVLSTGGTNYNAGHTTTNPSIGTAIFTLALACGLVVLTGPIGHLSVNARWALVAGEVVLAISYLAYLSNPTNVAAWLLGPGFSVAVLVCLFWPSVHVAFAAESAPSAASANSAGTQEMEPSVARALAEQQAKAAETDSSASAAKE